MTESKKDHVICMSYVAWGISVLILIWPLSVLAITIYNYNLKLILISLTKIFFKKIININSILLREKLFN